jgi:hypothetical protein
MFYRNCNYHISSLLNEVFTTGKPFNGYEHLVTLYEKENGRCIFQFCISALFEADKTVSRYNNCLRSH